MLYKKVLTIVCLVTLSSYSLKAQEYIIDSMLVDIEIDHDGAAKVVENIYVDFKVEKRGIIRDIPTDYTIEGKSKKVKIKNIDVINEKTKVTNARGMAQVRIGEVDKYLSGKKHYTINYTANSPFLKNESYEEFYWNVVGDKWDTSIGFVRFTIRVPSDTPIRYNDYRYFTGTEGSSDKNATVAITDNRIVGFTNQLLAPNEGLTVAVKLPSGFLLNQSFFAVEEESNQSPWWPLAPASIFFAILGWWKGLRGSKNEEKIVPISFPPEHLSPAEVGGFIDDVVHDRDVLSLIPFWGNMGLLKVTKTKDDIIFEKIKDISAERPDYEFNFFQAIFSSGPIVSLEQINKQMYKTIAETKSAIYKSFTADNLYDERYFYWFKSWRIILIGFLFVALGIVLIVINWLLVGFTFFGCGILCFILRVFKAPPSSKGLSLRSKLKGLEAHLKSEDPKTIAETIKKDPIYYERLYPFAFALGLDKSWTNRVSEYVNEVPYWYYTDNHPRTMSTFSESFTPKAITSAFIQYPESSNSSSSGGFSGGSSGGGFGGGGGSSW